jgi:hypothetical protein
VKKPKLTVVEPNELKPNLITPPSSLGEAGRTLWSSIQSEYRIDDAPGVATLLEICRSADRAAECAEAIAADGVTIRTKAGIREHPLVKVELGLRSFITRGLARLNLDVEPSRATVGRPPGTYIPRRG